MSNACTVQYIVLLIACQARVAARHGQERGAHLPHACDDLLNLGKAVYTVTWVLFGGALPHWQLGKVGGEEPVWKRVDQMVAVSAVLAFKASRRMSSPSKLEASRNSRRWGKSTELVVAEDRLIAPANWFMRARRFC
ncbi:hypothetical protein BJV78DRAFT_1158291 [Lactifluus subvellereus]|nr:hypothetical protein BJV78DRAFT_1158291 [Lactifluus subvellereus]